VVVRLIALRAWSPVLDSTTPRAMVSPGTTPVAATVRRLEAVPEAPRPIVTVPVVTDSLADVVDVNEPNVPRPAAPAAAASKAAEERIWARVERTRVDMCGAPRGEGRRRDGIGSRCEALVKYSVTP